MKLEPPPAPPDAGPPRDSWVGSMLAETYRILRPIGEGGMGAVYEATHARLPRRFAIKVLRADYLKQPQWVERFKREAEIASQLRHPHIVEVVDYNHAPDGRPYIVMEYLEGEDLSHRLARGKMPRAQALELLRQVGSALSAAHRRGVIHRDLKPQNIFLAHTDDGEVRVKVLDFGIAKLMNESGGLTSDNIVLGTPWYISPEQVLGKKDQVDARSDIFSLAVIAYQLLTGQAPFASDSVAATLHQVAYDDPPSPREIDPDIDKRLEATLLRGLSKQREERFADAELFTTALAGGQERISLRVPEPEPGEPLPSQIATARTIAQPRAATTARVVEREGAPKKRSNLGLIALFSAMTVVFVATFAGILYLAKERNKAKRANTSARARRAVRPAITPDARAPAPRPDARVLTRKATPDAKAAAVVAPPVDAVPKPRRHDKQPTRRAQRKTKPSKPTVAKPVVTKPVVSKADVTKPVVTKPVVTKPVVTKPVKPTGTKPGSGKAPAKKPGKGRDDWIVQPEI